MNLQASFLSKSSLLSHFSTSVLIVIPPKLQKSVQYYHNYITQKHFFKE